MIELHEPHWMRFRQASVVLYKIVVDTVPFDQVSKALLLERLMPSI